MTADSYLNPDARSQEEQRLYTTTWDVLHPPYGHLSYGQACKQADTRHTAPTVVARLKQEADRGSRLLRSNLLRARQARRPRRALVPPLPIPPVSQHSTPAQTQALTASARHDACEALPPYTRPNRIGSTSPLTRTFRTLSMRCTKIYNCHRRLPSPGHSLPPSTFPYPTSVRITCRFAPFAHPSLLFHSGPYAPPQLVAHANPPPCTPLALLVRQQQQAPLVAACYALTARQAVPRAAPSLLCNYNPLPRTPPRPLFPRPRPAV